MEQPAKLGVLAGQMHVGLELGRAVAQPHRIDVAGDDERIGLTAHLAREDRGVERVGIAVLEQPGELGVADLRLHPRDLGLDGLAGEAALGLRGALRHPSLGSHGGPWQRRRHGKGTCTRQHVAAAEVHHGLSH